MISNNGISVALIISRSMTMSLEHLDHPEGSYFDEDYDHYLHLKY